LEERSIRGAVEAIRSRTSGVIFGGQVTLSA
jgi:hypothetical protein